jgi:hypothetical protein
MECIHDTIILSDTDEAIREKCKLCKKNFVYTKDSQGRVDNARYLKDHKKLFAQPNGRTGKVYKKVHGEPVDVHEKTRKMRAEAHDNIDAQADEDLFKIDMEESTNNKKYY